jgi:hypothetical protein
MINKQGIGTDVKGIRRGLIIRNIPELSGATDESPLKGLNIP